MQSPMLHPTSMTLLFYDWVDKNTAQNNTAVQQWESGSWLKPCPQRQRHLIQNFHWATILLSWKDYSGQKRTREEPKHPQSCTALGDEPNRILPREIVVTTWKQSPKRLSGIKTWLLCLQFCTSSNFHEGVWTTDRKSCIVLQHFFFLAVLFSSAQKRPKYRFYIRKDRK